MDIIKLKLDELNRLQSVRDDLKQFNIEVKNGLYELHDRLRGYTLCDS